MNFVRQAIQVLGNIGPNVQNLSMLDSCRDKLVPFVGAGISIHYGYPSWNGLLETIAIQVGLGDAVRGHISRFQFEEAAELLVKEASFTYLDDSLRRAFDRSKLSRPLLDGPVSFLPRFAQGPVITTNFDHVLEIAFEDARRPFAEIFKGSQIREASRALQLDQPFLLKLHGDYSDSENRILTLEEYAREYGHSDPGQVDLNMKLPTVLTQALGSRPLLFLGCALKNDRTLTVISRIAAKYRGTVHFALLSEAELHIDRLQQLYSWNIRPIFFPSGCYEKIGLFLGVLADSLERPATSSAVRHGLSFRQRREMVFVNGYKLFYFRKTRKLSLSGLSRLSGVNLGQLKRIEKVENRVDGKGIYRFQQCPKTVLARLEKAMDCQGQLAANRGDDFLSMYVQFYMTYRGTSPTVGRSRPQMKLKFETKVVAFDFDGTLTQNRDHRTTWERIWVALGYKIEDCSDLHRRFSRKEFSHQTWCDLTFEKFKKAGMTETLLRRIARNIKLVDGVRETLRILKNKGVRLYLVSGSIRQIIRLVMGDLYDLFDAVTANEIRFDSNGNIIKIEGTKFDFEGKADFLRRVVSENSLSELDVLFVGNSLNDIYASRSGARTLCVNPHLTNPEIEEHWTYCIPEMKNLKQILQHVKI